MENKKREGEERERVIFLANLNLRWCLIYDLLKFTKSPKTQNIKYRKFGLKSQKLETGQSARPSRQPAGAMTQSARCRVFEVNLPRRQKVGDMTGPPELELVLWWSGCVARSFKAPPPFSLSTKFKAHSTIYLPTTKNNNIALRVFQ